MDGVDRLDQPSNSAARGGSTERFTLLLLNWGTNVTDKLEGFSMKAEVAF